MEAVGSQEEVANEKSSGGAGVMENGNLGAQGLGMVQPKQGRTAHYRGLTSVSSMRCTIV